MLESSVRGTARRLPDGAQALTRPRPGLSSAAARLLAALSGFPGKVAIEAEEGSLTFGDLEERSRAYALSLKALGILPGERVAVFAGTSPDLVIALLGHHRLGAIHVPINTRYREEEAGHILRDSGAAAVLFEPGSPCAAVLRAAGDLPALRLRIALGPERRGGRGMAAVPFRSLAADAAPGRPLPPLPRDCDPALLIYTSGTTGKSKGVELSYRALVANVAATTGLWEFSEADRLALALPLFHVHGLCLGIHGTLLHGMTALLFDRFEAGAVVDAFRTRGASIFMGVPTMYVRLLERIAGRPDEASALSRGRLFTAGSAPLPADDFRAFLRTTGHAILERYGMSETLFTLSNPFRGERRPGTVGLPVPGCEVRLAGDDGGDVPDGALGEILVKSNGIMTGYWGREAETRANFRDGWFLTGDVARRAKDGTVTIVGRKSVDVIKSGGFKISAREIEDVLRRHPLVREVAVVGAPDRVWGQRVVAAVVLSGRAPAGGAPALLDELSAFSARHLADYKRPRQVVVLEVLPRNALGKVQKHLVLSDLLDLPGRRSLRPARRCAARPARRAVGSAP